MYFSGSIASCISRAFLILSIPFFLIECASAPKMATVEKDGESVDIVFTSTFMPGSRQIRNVKLAPDKSNIMITFTDGKSVVIDSLNGIDPNPANKEILGKKKDPWCSKEGSLQGAGWSTPPVTYFNKVTESPDHVYTFNGERFSLNIRKNGKLLPLGRSGTMEILDVPVYYSSNTSIAVLSGWEDHLFEIYDIKTNKVLYSTEIPSTDGTQYRQYSMSADDKSEKLFVHSCYFIQLYDLKSAKHLANLIFTDRNNWVIVSDSGKYDGTTEAVKQLAWKVGKEEIPLINFGASFYIKGLLGHLLEYSRAEAVEPETKIDEANSIDVKKQLIGTIRKISPHDIIISIGQSKRSLSIGDKLFVLIDGKKTILEVTYPMMASAKCKIKLGNKSLTEGMPVFVEK